MFRLDLATARAEFVGGFGGRIISLNSNRMLITPSEVLINFVNESVQPSSGFEVRIERGQLGYELVFEEGQKTGQPTLTGRCSVLDGEQLRASTQNLLLSLYSSKQSKQPSAPPRAPSFSWPSSTPWRCGHPRHGDTTTHVRQGAREEKGLRDML